MALEFGFYDSINGDRRYNAIQMSEIFEGLINDGVYASVGETFATYATAGMTVAVGSGRAWFKNTWNRNRGRLPLEVSQADPAFDRIDSVVLQVNSEDMVRHNDIILVKGNVALSPEPPILQATGKVYFLRLANIRVKAGATNITAADITITVGSSECPFVTSILQQTNIDVLFAKWDKEFRDWWDTIRLILNENVATNLQNQIDALNGRVDKSIMRVGDISFSSNAIPFDYGTWEKLDGHEKSIASVHTDVVLKRLGIESFDNLESIYSLKVFNTFEQMPFSVVIRYDHMFYYAIDGWEDEYLVNMIIEDSSSGSLYYHNSLLYLNLKNGCSAKQIHYKEQCAKDALSDMCLIPIGTAYTLIFSDAVRSGSTINSITLLLFQNDIQTIVQTTVFNDYTWPTSIGKNMIAYYKKSSTETMFYIKRKDGPSRYIDLYQVTVGIGNVINITKTKTFEYCPIYRDENYIYIIPDAWCNRRIKISTGAIETVGANSGTRYFYKVPYVDGPVSSIYTIPDLNSVYCFQLIEFTLPDESLANTRKQVKRFDLFLTIHELAVHEESLHVKTTEASIYTISLGASSGVKIKLDLPSNNVYSQHIDLLKPNLGKLLYMNDGVYYILYNNGTITSVDRVDNGTLSLGGQVSRMSLIGWKLPSYKDLENSDSVLTIKPFIIKPTIKCGDDNYPIQAFVNGFDELSRNDVMKQNDYGPSEVNNTEIYGKWITKTTDFMIPVIKYLTSFSLDVLRPRTVRGKEVQYGYMMIK